jgi:hypothetical protein
MPVSYDSSQLLKCTVSFTYSRYVISRTGNFASQSEEPKVTGEVGRAIEQYQVNSPIPPGPLNGEQYGLPNGTIGIRNPAFQR